MLSGPQDHAFHPGQRWISVSEPELGLGEIKNAGVRTVTVVFRASKETREYAIANAPLRRAAYRAGDAIRSADRQELRVDAVVERNGLFFYQCGARELCETALSDTLTFGSPTERLFATQFDAPGLFDLRVAALTHQHDCRQSDVRGFLGGRIDLLPHQLSIASEVTRRLTPRVLLADEVGLGKTIEACLILHRLILTGRASRVLIVVPESLVHQWFLELLRRFNLWFHIYDEGRCTAIEEAEPGANPFLEHQCLVCHLGIFTENRQRVQQAVDAGWDLLVVDEAHHLRWSPEAASPEYLAIETLGRSTPGLLLLTATPEQLGVASHFARLRLLDPERFHDLAAFTRETAGYHDLANLAQAVKSGQALSQPDVARLARILDEADSSIETVLSSQAASDWARRQSWIDAMLDRHGTGRVMFRNTRAAVAGFTMRLPALHPLQASAAGSALFKALAQEWAADTDSHARAAFRPGLGRDPRVEWLAGFLRASGTDKVLAICSSEQKAVAIEKALAQHSQAPVGAFHEGMSLVQRDRSAAWFAERDGARLLICSEIGSEGRNFQFAHHLVLFDLPLDPSLLEQRIGRLDRIGQTDAVNVHVPFVAGSHLEVLAHWYQDGLNAFAESVQGGRELQEQFDAQLRGLAGQVGQAGRAGQAKALTELVDTGQRARREVAARLEQGRDRLLEWNSFRPDVAAAMVSEIQRADADDRLDEFMLAVFDVYFIQVEETAPRTYRLGSAGVLHDMFPGLTAEGLTVTSDRRRALVREEQQFLTWDHPLVTGALDMLLGSEHGNCSFGRWVDAEGLGLYLEAVYVLQAVAPPALHADRFLPPTPVRVVVDHRGQDASGVVTPQVLKQLVKSHDGRHLLARADVRDTILPRLIGSTRQLATMPAEHLIADARAKVRTRLDAEATRLRSLQKVNPTVRDEEIALLESQQRDLDSHVASATLRLDALRLIHRGR